MTEVMSASTVPLFTDEDGLFCLFYLMRNSTSPECAFVVNCYDSEDENEAIRYLCGFRAGLMTSWPCTPSGRSRS